MDNKQQSYPLIVAFTGPAGSGKTTLASKIADNSHPYFESRIYSFSLPIKETLMSLFDLSYTQIYYEKNIPLAEWWNLTPRQMMQKFGTESMRDVFGQDIWIKMAERWITDNIIYSIKPKVLLIDDLRFINEARWVCKNNGIIIYVKNKDAAAVMDHQSEQEFDMIKNIPHFIVINNKDCYDELPKKVDNIINLIIKLVREQQQWRG